MKKCSFISLIFVLIFLAGCSKHMKFEVPNGDITIYKNPSCLDGTEIEYKPLIISNQKEKEVLINNVNSWRLVVDHREHKSSCNLYEITWENHNITVYGGTEILGIGIDKESYDLTDGSVDFLNIYVFEQLD